MCSSDLRLTNQSTPFAKIKIKPKLLDQFINQLPFAPTKAQERVIAEIFSDLSKPKPCSRLVQGDVGSGKTVVAAASLIQAAANTTQRAALIAEKSGSCLGSSEDHE